MAAPLTVPERNAPAIPGPLKCFILCDHCGAVESPGFTYLTAWGLLCALCHDAYESAHGAGEEGF